MEKDRSQEAGTAFLKNPFRWTRERWQDGGMVTKGAMVGATLGALVGVGEVLMLTPMPISATVKAIDAVAMGIFFGTAGAVLGAMNGWVISDVLNIKSFRS